MKTKSILLALLLLNFCHNTYAQSYYMHEAAEDNEGGFFEGIGGTLLLIGIGYILDKLYKKEDE